MQCTLCTYVLYKLRVLNRWNVLEGIKDIYWHLLCMKFNWICMIKAAECSRVADPDPVLLRFESGFWRAGSIRIRYEHLDTDPKLLKKWLSFYMRGQHLLVIQKWKHPIKNRNIQVNQCNFDAKRIKVFKQLS